MNIIYYYNGEEIWLNENYNDLVTLESHFKVDGVLELIMV